MNEYLQSYHKKDSEDENSGPPTTEVHTSQKKGWTYDVHPCPPMQTRWLAGHANLLWSHMLVCEYVSPELLNICDMCQTFFKGH